MFRELRRKKNAIDIPTAKALFFPAVPADAACWPSTGTTATLTPCPSITFTTNRPRKSIFTGARAGHKFDALQACDKVCFTVYGNETVKDATWAPYLQSAVVFGRCHLVEDGPRAMELLKKVAMKYLPHRAAGR